MANVTLKDKNGKELIGAGAKLEAANALVEALAKGNKTTNLTDCGTNCICQYRTPKDEDLDWQGFEARTSVTTIRDGPGEAVFHHTALRAVEIVTGGCVGSHIGLRSVQGSIPDLAMTITDEREEPISLNELEKISKVFDKQAA